MGDPPCAECRYFLTYSGVKLPLKPVTAITEADTRNRNTYLRACYDGQDRLVVLEKIVYGEIELEHRYQYHANGQLGRAEIHLVADEELTVLRFDDSGVQLGMVDQESP